MQILPENLCIHKIAVGSQAAFRQQDDPIPLGHLADDLKAVFPPKMGRLGVALVNAQSNAPKSLIFQFRAQPGDDFCALAGSLQ